MSSSLSFSHLDFAWPDGRTVFRDLTFAAPPGLSGIVGRNGIGKSTLLRLAVGELDPVAGSVRRPSVLGYVPQHVALDVGETVADALRIGSVVRALRAIEDGSTEQRHYDMVGDDWDIDARAAEVLESLGLGALSPERTLGEVSGGEATLLAVGAGLLQRPDVLLLDEPTNNLDSAARVRLTEALSRREGSTLVVTHDRALLGVVTQIGELRERHDRSTELRWFGGAIDAYEEAIAVEAAAVEQATATAAADVARQRADLRRRVEGGAKRGKQAAKARANAKVSGMAVKAKKDQAAASDARVRREHQERLDTAQTRLDEATSALPRDRAIRVDLPDTSVPPRREVLVLNGLLTVTGLDVTASVRGPERVAVSGPNGGGKTTLLRTILGRQHARAGTVDLRVPTGYLPQRLDVLDSGLSVIDNVRRAAAEAPLQEVRDQLGRFQFRGAEAEALAGTLSGGERFRAALASVLLAKPSPQLLIMDEPTNNLDFEAQEQLAQALDAYQGALIVVSHDPAFLAQIQPTREWVVDGGFEDRDLRAPMS